MNQKQITEKLNNLKQIEPRPAFVNHARLWLALQPRQKNTKVLALPWLVFAGALGAILIAANVLNTNVVQPRLALYFSQNDLRQEFAKLAAGLQLTEISYQQNIDAAIVVALNEISDAQPNHLNPSLLQKERKALENGGVSQNGAEIDALLEKLIAE